jgi:hypothetical protein
MSGQFVGRSEPNLTHVWLLSILTSRGTEFYVCRNEDVARAQLFEYVRDLWDDTYKNDEIPVNQSEAVHMYFWENERESYILVKEPILEEIV